MRLGHSEHTSWTRPEPRCVPDSSQNWAKLSPHFKLTHVCVMPNLAWHRTMPSLTHWLASYHPARAQPRPQPGVGCRYSDSVMPVKARFVITASNCNLSTSEQTSAPSEFPEEPQGTCRSLSLAHAHYSKVSAQTCQELSNRLSNFIKDQAAAASNRRKSDSSLSQK